MMHQSVVTIIVALAAVSGPHPQAAPRLALVLDSRAAPPQLLHRPRRAPVIEALIPLSVKNVRLELVPQSETPMAALTFEMYNDGANSLTDIVLDVSILRKPEDQHADASQTVLAGPYRIRAKMVLRPGHTMHYEMRMRNLLPDCDCLPSVEVVSVRSLSADRSAAVSITNDRRLMGDEASEADPGSHDSDETRLASTTR